MPMQCSHNLACPIQDSGRNLFLAFLRFRKFISVLLYSLSATLQHCAMVWLNLGSLTLSGQHCKPPGARLIHALCPLIRMWHHRMSLEPVVPYTQCGIWSKAARLGTVQWYEYFKENVNMFCRDILYEICVLWWILNRLALTSELEVYVPCRQSILLLYLIAFFVFLLLISKL